MRFKHKSKFFANRNLFAYPPPLPRTGRAGRKAPRASNVATDEPHDLRLRRMCGRLSLQISLLPAITKNLQCLCAFSVTWRARSWSSAAAREKPQSYTCCRRRQALVPSPCGKEAKRSSGEFKRGRAPLPEWSTVAAVGTSAVPARGFLRAGFTCFSE